MALITCSECGKKYSDNAPSCPNCACPTDIVKKNIESDDKNKEDVSIGSIGKQIGSLVDSKLKNVKNSIEEKKNNIQEKLDEKLADKKNEEIREEKKEDNKEKKKDFDKKTKNNNYNTIIIVAFVISLLLIINKQTRPPFTVLIFLFAVFLYGYSICIKNNIIEEKYNISNKKSIIIFWMCIAYVILGITLNFIDPITNDKYVVVNDNNDENETVKDDSTKEEKKEEQKDDTNIEDETVTEDETNTEVDNKILMPSIPSNYIGLDYKLVVEQIKALGFTNIVTEVKETTDTNMVNDTIAEFTINGQSYEIGDSFLPTDEVKIVYWLVKQPPKEEIKIVYPKEGSKLAKDYDSTSSSNSRIYMNVDGVKNVPKLQKYEKTYITDGVYEYINYLKELGFKVEITEYNNRTPYSGFNLYEVNFKVSKNNFSWTMYLSIDDEKYVEYEFYIMEH